MIGGGLDTRLRETEIENPSKGASEDSFANDDVFTL